METLKSGPEIDKNKNINPPSKPIVEGDGAPELVIKPTTTQSMTIDELRAAEIAALGYPLTKKE